MRWWDVGFEISEPCHVSTRPRGSGLTAKENPPFCFPHTFTLLQGPTQAEPQISMKGWWDELAATSTGMAGPCTSVGSYGQCPGGPVSIVLCIQPHLSTACLSASR